MRARTHTHARTHARTHTHTHTHTQSQQDSLKGGDFKDGVKGLSVFDDLTWQKALFQAYGAA